MSKSDWRVCTYNLSSSWQTLFLECYCLSTRYVRVVDEVNFSNSGQIEQRMSGCLQIFSYTWCRTLLSVRVLQVTLILAWSTSLVLILTPDNLHKVAQRPPIRSNHNLATPADPSQAQNLNAGQIVRLVILLQQSAVQQGHQLSRLEAIDNGWAKWTQIDASATSTAFLDMKVMAPIPSSSSSSSSSSSAGAKWLTINAFPSLDIAESSASPFHRLVHGLTVILSTEDVKWLLLANDHSFIIPHNLAKFVKSSSLNPDEAIYTGNKLALSYRKHRLLFASGGAGAVLSHVTAKAVWLVWMLLADDVSVFSRGMLDSGRLEAIECDRSGEKMRIEAATSDFFTTQMATSLKAWVQEAQNATRNSVDTLCGTATALTPVVEVEVVLSPLVSFTIKKTPPGGHYRVSFTQGAHDNAMGEMDDQQLRDACAPAGKWAHDNPGIILMHCLHKLMDLQFASSYTNHVAQIDKFHKNASLVRGDRFNVYGPLRTVLGDFDEWYRDAKTLAERDTNSSYDISALARDAVSFHYVSETESRLLYQLLSDSASHDVGGNIPPICMSNNKQAPLKTPCTTQYDLQRLWPQTDAEAGHYSRHISKGDRGDKEAALLFDYLSNIAEALHS